MKASQLMRVQSVQHCVAHSLHLLITVDSITRVDELTTLVQKCRDIVTVLHFKSYMLEEENTSLADAAKLEELRKKIKMAQEIIDLDDQFPISLDNSIVNADPESAGTVGESSHHPHKHATLKGSCPTRWNSTLAMIESVCDLQKAVDNSLKKISHAELCFNANEVELLQALKTFLKEFAKFT